MSALERLARAGRSHAVVSELTRDPDPAPTHEYQPDPQSGAGNCTCGMAERHRRHPHEFMGAASEPTLCTCGQAEGAICHRPAPSGSDEQGDRPATPDANGVHDTKGGE